MSPFTVAIDGPAASGKGTISRALATRFGFAHLDTGLLYRAVGAAYLEGAEPLAAAQTLEPQAFENPDLRTPSVAQAASKVAAIPEVRSALLDFQRAFARRAGGAVLDGRDIGSVICPQAEVKLYVTASAEVRAQRRFEELTNGGLSTDYNTVLDDVKQRDRRDAERADAPMVAAEDALTLDTTTMSIAEAVAFATSLVEEKINAIKAL
jgi:cytidylate kinase